LWGRQLEVNLKLQDILMVCYSKARTIFNSTDHSKEYNETLAKEFCWEVVLAKRKEAGFPLVEGLLDDLMDLIEQGRKIHHASYLFFV
jgi:hypothetical protein